METTSPESTRWCPPFEDLQILQEVRQQVERALLAPTMQPDNDIREENSLNKVVDVMNNLSANKHQQNTTFIKETMNDINRGEINEGRECGLFNARKSTGERSMTPDTRGGVEAHAGVEERTRLSAMGMTQEKLDEIRTIKQEESEQNLIAGLGGSHPGVSSRLINRPGDIVDLTLDDYSGLSVAGASMMQYGPRNGPQTNLLDNFHSMRLISPFGSTGGNVPLMQSPRMPESETYGIEPRRPPRQVLPSEFILEMIPNGSYQNMNQHFTQPQIQGSGNEVAQTVSSLSYSTQPERVTVTIPRSFTPGEVRSQNSAMGSIYEIPVHSRRNEILRRITELENQARMASQNPAGEGSSRSSRQQIGPNENLELLKSLLAAYDAAQNSAVRPPDPPETQGSMNPQVALTHNDSQSILLVNNSQSSGPAQEQLKRGTMEPPGRGHFALANIIPQRNVFAVMQPTRVSAPEGGNDLRDNRLSPTPPLQPQVNEVAMTMEEEKEELSRKRKRDVQGTVKCPSCAKLFVREFQLYQHWGTGSCLQYKSQKQLIELCKVGTFDLFDPMIRDILAEEALVTMLGNPILETLIPGESQRKKKKGKKRKVQPIFSDPDLEDRYRIERMTTRSMVRQPISSQTENTDTNGRMATRSTGVHPIMCPAMCGESFPDFVRVQMHIYEDGCFKDQPKQWLLRLCRTGAFKDDLIKACRQYGIEIDEEMTEAPEDGVQRSQMEADSGVDLAPSAPETRVNKGTKLPENVSLERGLFQSKTPTVVSQSSNVVPSREPIFTNPPKQNLSSNEGLLLNAFQNLKERHSLPQKPMPNIAEQNKKPIQGHTHPEKPVTNISESSKEGERVQQSATDSMKNLHKDAAANWLFKTDVASYAAQLEAKEHELQKAFTFVSELDKVKMPGRPAAMEKDLAEPVVRSANKTPSGNTAIEREKSLLPISPEPMNVTPQGNGALHDANSSTGNLPSPRTGGFAAITPFFMRAASTKDSAEGGSSRILLETTTNSTNNGGTGGTGAGTGILPENLMTFASQVRKYTETAQKMRDQPKEVVPQSAFTLGNNQLQKPVNVFGNTTSPPAQSQSNFLSPKPQATTAMPPKPQATASMPFQLGRTSERSAFGSSYVPLSPNSLFQSNNSTNNGNPFTTLFPSTFTRINPSPAPVNAFSPQPTKQGKQEVKIFSATTPFSNFSLRNSDNSNSAFGKGFGFTNNSPVPHGTAQASSLSAWNAGGGNASASGFTGFRGGNETEESGKED